MCACWKLSVVLGERHQQINKVPVDTGSETEMKRNLMLGNWVTVEVGRESGEVENSSFRGDTYSKGTWDSEVQENKNYCTVDWHGMVGYHMSRAE